MGGGEVVLRSQDRITRRTQCQSQTQSPFFTKLLQEIRLQIYEECAPYYLNQSYIRTQRPHYITAGKRVGEFPQFLLACKRILFEAEPAIFQTVRIDIPDMFWTSVRYHMDQFHPPAEPRPEEEACIYAIGNYTPDAVRRVLINWDPSFKQCMRALNLGLIKAELRGILEDAMCKIRFVRLEIGMADEPKVLSENSAIKCRRSICDQLEHFMDFFQMLPNLVSVELKGLYRKTWLKKLRKRYGILIVGLAVRDFRTGVKKRAHLESGAKQKFVLEGDSAVV